MTTFIEIVYAIAMIVFGVGIGFGAKALGLTTQRTATLAGAMGFSVATIAMLLTMREEQQLREVAYLMVFYTIGVFLGALCYILLDLSCAWLDRNSVNKDASYPRQPVEFMQARPSLYNPGGKLKFLD